MSTCIRVRGAWYGGWCWHKVVARLEAMGNALNKQLGRDLVIEKVETREDMRIMLNNPPLIRRFEFLVRFFSLPSASEYDPTLFIAITFPVIFGMILGDIGYGVLAMLLAILIYRGAKEGFYRSLAGMMLLSGFMTVVWGYIFGEFLGSDMMLGIKLHPYIERGGAGVVMLMAAALIVGMIHLGAGLVIGFYTNLKHGHKEHAIAKACWLLVEIGFVLVGLTLFAPGIFGSGLVAAGVVVLGILGLIKYEGARGVVEIPGLISNMLSYLRIMALGLSGVILAKLVNIIPVGAALDSLMHSVTAGNPVGIILNIIPLVIFAVVFALGHAVALGLGLFESGIQSLRLHYVEFFSKFYHGGGAAFVPLRGKQD